MNKHINMVMWQSAGSFENIAVAGDTVDEDIAMSFMYSMPPIVLDEDEDGIKCFQNSEPYSHEVKDGGTGFAPTYSTFERKNGVWRYLGHCFRGETINRTYENQ